MQEAESNEGIKSLSPRKRSSLVARVQRWGTL